MSYSHRLCELRMWARMLSLILHDRADSSGNETMAEGAVGNCIRCLTEVKEHMYTADIKVHFIQVICANDHLQPYSEECAVDFPVITNLN